ncbi:hypothetical protein DER44DRAFT_827885 [Fusarium oxysporum]|nr:hypothetical protein DER44DRAFT_827885 [Fusarium oxysporum]
MASAATEGTRANRRREQNRLAQRRFRERKRNKPGDEEDSNDTGNKRQMRSTRKHPEHEREPRSPSCQSETDDHGKDLEDLFASPTTQRSFGNGDTFGGSAEMQSYSPLGSGTNAPADVFTFGDPHATSQLEIDPLLYPDFSTDEFGPENTQADDYSTGIPGFTPVETLSRGIIDYGHQGQSSREDYDSSQRSYRHFARSSGLHSPVVTSPSLRQPKSAFSLSHSQDRLENDLMKQYLRYEPPTFATALLLPLPQQVLRRRGSGPGRNL